MDETNSRDRQPTQPASDEASYDNTAYYEFAAPTHKLTAPGGHAGGSAAQNEGQPPVSQPTSQPARRSSKRFIYGMVAVALAVLVILAGTSVLLFARRPVPKAGSVPNPYHVAKCPFQLGAGMVEGQTVTCGFLTVPEERDQAHSANIQLAVATFKAPQPKASATPMLYLTGGPGGGALGDLGSYISTQNLPDITLGRDLILLDQRGTGYSKPALNCHEFDDLQKATLNLNLSYESSNARYLEAAKACHDRLVKAGIHLTAYTTINNAMDVHDLIHAIGYKQVDLYGVSYGTRLAQTVMRLYPGDLRSVILDSTVPTQENLYTSLPTVTQHAYDVLLNGCAASTKCRSEYPDISGIFYKLVSDLNAHPVTFQDARYGPVLLNGDGLAGWLFTAQYVTQLIPVLPEVIMQVSKGDFSYLSQLYGELVLRNDISYGMYYSVECGEDMAYTNEQDLEQAVNVLRPEIREGNLASLQADFSVCEVWGQNAVPTVQKQAVVSTVPTLVLSGEYDPITPAANGQLVMKTLSHSYFFLFPATGHGVFLTGQCPDTVMESFLTNPQQKPMETCVTGLGEPSFQ